LLIYLFIPWQVAFLGSWLIHLYTCATPMSREPIPASISSPALASSELSIPLARLEPDQGSRSSSEPESEEDGKYLQSYRCHTDNHHHSMHFLLLMTWLLPLAAPVLAVWVRTLMTAGFTTPFSGGHFFLGVAPFLIFVDFASWTTGPLFAKHQ
jgi:GPI inositol-deacylase